MQFQFIMLALLIHVNSCQSVNETQKKEKGILHKRTYFYSTNGNRTFSDTSNIWYNDSTTIQEFHTTDTVTDTANITKTTFKTFLHRYIDLRSKTWYNYITFSDTAKIVNKGFLPDTAFTDYGWSYFSDKILQIQGIPKILSDTIIDNTTYKRAKFSFVRDDPKKNFTIGYFRCDGKGDLFSLEKSFSRKQNCTMTKLFSYRKEREKPYASLEVDFVSDTLTPRELKVFAAWGKNAKENPVQR